MQISVDHPQFEDFLEDGAVTNNQTKSEFFEEVLKNFEISSTNGSIDISKYELSDINQSLIVKHLASDDFDSLEFKYIED